MIASFLIVTTAAPNYHTLLKPLCQNGIDFSIRQHNRVGLHTAAAAIGDDHRKICGGTFLQAASSFAVVNNYGPFAVMTTERNEIIIEGSQDGEHWLEYGFKYKPDAVDKPLSWNIPHQPRLDWQMWFAALSEPQAGGWFEKFMQRLQEGSADVLALLAHNPFAKQPPAYLRAYLYRFTFTHPDQRAISGHIWKREKIRLYWP